MLAMKRISLLALLICWPSMSSAQDTQGVNRALPGIDRFRDFVHVAILSPTPYVLALGGGVLDQMGNMPEEWDGGDAFAKRFTARMGGGFASDAIGHSAAALMHHRVLYDRCACRGWSRFRHAMGRAFVSMHENGRSAPNYSLWIAKFSAAGLANTWYPPSYTRGDILREASIGIVVAGGLNVLNEFSPELLKLIPFR
jgi:hypothetical protein